MAAFVAWLFGAGSVPAGPLVWASTATLPMLVIGALLALSLVGIICEREQPRVRPQRVRPRTPRPLPGARGQFPHAV